MIQGILIIVILSASSLAPPCALCPLTGSQTVYIVSSTDQAITMNPDASLSLADLMNFMKEEKESRKEDLKKFEEKLKIERETDKNDLATDISSLTSTLTNLVETGVAKGIENAVKPLEETQKSMHNEQTKLIKKVTELEKRLETVAVTSATKSNLTESTSIDNTAKNDVNEARRAVIKSAKRILGFSKVTEVHIKQAKDEHGIADDDEEKARRYAIFDFLYYEMKLPEDKIKPMKIVRTFRPSREPDSDRLYAEFEDEASAVLINLYVRNLRPGRKVDIWIPPSLYLRYRDFDHANYNIRTGPGDFKAKVKYGETDFVLIKKSPTCRSWTTVIPPENLSPMDLSVSTYASVASSPPLGRESRTKRKASRSPPNTAFSSKTFRPAVDPANVPRMNEDDETKTGEKSPPALRKNLTSQTTSFTFSKNRSIFSQEKEFSFSPVKSALKTKQF